MEGGRGYVRVNLSPVPKGLRDLAALQVQQSSRFFSEIFDLDSLNNAKS